MTESTSNSTGRKLLIMGAIIVLFPIVLFATGVLLMSEPESASIPPEWKLEAGVSAWDEGLLAYDAGNFEEAVAYWRQVPPTDPEYARSLRYVGWEIYADQLGQPRKALPYVHKSLIEKPFDGSSWQDLGRTYAGLIGL